MRILLALLVFAVVAIIHVHYVSGQSRVKNVSKRSNISGIFVYLNFSHKSVSISNGHVTFLEQNAYLCTSTF